jgi:hypothetical protein
MPTLADDEQEGVALLRSIDASLKTIAANGTALNVALNTLGLTFAPILNGGVTALAALAGEATSANITATVAAEALASSAASLATIAAQDVPTPPVPSALELTPESGS